MGRGRFRVRGDVIEVQPADTESAYRISLFGDEVESITHFDPMTGEVYARLDHLAVYPATHYAMERSALEAAVKSIDAELRARLPELEAEGKMLEAHRLRSRTEYDMEMLREMGFCNGIENYSRHLDGREPGTPPHTLLDYFPDDYPDHHRRVAPDGARRSAACTRATGRASRRSSSTGSGCRRRSTTGRCGSTSSSSGPTR